MTRLFPNNAQQKEEHIQWVIQQALLNDGFIFAVLALGASLSQTGSLTSVDHPEPVTPPPLVASRHAITLVIKAIMWLHEAITCDKAAGWIHIAYGVACLIFIEVRYSLSAVF